MPAISEFYGIIIRMFFTDHNPPPFHAIYGEFELIVAISPIRIMSGKVPNRVRSMVLEGRHCTRKNFLRIGTVAKKAAIFLR
jgi:hypothetical protein